MQVVKNYKLDFVKFSSGKRFFKSLRWVIDTIVRIILLKLQPNSIINSKKQKYSFIAPYFFTVASDKRQQS